MLGDLVQAWKMGRATGVAGLADVVDDLCWLEGATASVAVPYLYAMYVERSAATFSTSVHLPFTSPRTRLHLQDDSKANRTRIWRQAIWAFYNVMREQPDALLVDLLCYNPTIK